MFGRTVKIGNVEVFVPCCPDTPLSEVLVRAAQIQKRDEADVLKIGVAFGQSTKRRPGGVVIW